MKQKYWFRPKRFFGFFAAYYPVTLQGWLVTVFCVFLLVKIFVMIDAFSYSGSDTLIRFFPWAVAVFLLFDVISFRTGEYPEWWKRYRKK